MVLFSENRQRFPAKIRIVADEKMRARKRRSRFRQQVRSGRTNAVWTIRRAAPIVRSSTSYVLRQRVGGGGKRISNWSADVAEAVKREHANQLVERGKTDLIENSFQKRPTFETFCCARWEVSWEFHLESRRERPGKKWATVLRARHVNRRTPLDLSKREVKRK